MPDASSYEDIMTTEKSRLSQLQYSVKQTAELLNICRATVYNEIRAGRLHRRKFGKRTFIPAESIQQWISALSSNSAN